MEANETVTENPVGESEAEQVGNGGMNNRVAGPNVVGFEAKIEISQFPDDGSVILSSTIVPFPPFLKPLYVKELLEVSSKRTANTFPGAIPDALKLTETTEPAQLMPTIRGTVIDTAPLQSSDETLGNESRVRTWIVAWRGWKRGAVVRRQAERRAQRDTSGGPRAKIRANFT
jgi:hypothetical protein